MYFDAVKFTAIDPMHNLFLGTAKHVFKLWIKKNLLTKKGLKVPECLKSESILLMLGQELVDYLITLHQTIVVALHHSGRTGLLSIPCSVWRVYFK